MALLQSTPVPATTGGGGVAVVLGTRPEIIKLSGIIELLGERAYVVHTGQHYDETLSDAFFVEHGLDAPDVLLDVGGLRRGGQIGRAVTELDRLFDVSRPAAVVVQGDTNATLAGALAANAAGIPLVHVEAGLRSFDRAMPEEHNRVLVDHLADLCCAATAANRANLAAEGIADGVVVTGNTVVEAVQRVLPPEHRRRRTVERLGLLPDQYVLATIHRPENTDDRVNLTTILGALAGCGRPVILPLHPRTRAAVHRHGLGRFLDRLGVMDPVGSAEFLSLAAHAALLVSDSGGVQEECTVLKRPLVVVRNSTERPESLEHFARLVAPTDLADAMGDLLRAGAAHLAGLAEVPSPYGDGRASQRIVSQLDQVTHLGRGAVA